MRNLESLGTLAIYKKEDNQVFRRYDHTNPDAPNKQCYFTPAWMIPPFMFRRPPGTDIPSDFRILKSDGTLAYVLDSGDIQFNQYLIQGTTYDYFCYKPQTLKSSSGFIFEMAAGEFYYLEIEFGNGTSFYYSEIFFVPAECADGTIEHDLELVMNNDFITGAGAFNVPGWIRNNTSVTWDTPHQIELNTGTVTGNMFQKAIPINGAPLEWYRVCVEVISLSSSIIPTERLRLVTGDGTYVFPNGVPGTYCFYTTNPGTLQFNSNGVTWAIGSVSVKKFKGYSCLAHIKYWGDCFSDGSQTESNPGKKFEMPFDDFDYYGILFLKSVVDSPQIGISKPDYEEEQESDKNGDLESFESFDKQWKTNKYFHAFAIEPIVDQLKKIQSYDRVTFYDPWLDEFWDKNEETDEITTEMQWADDTFANQVVIHLKEGLILKTGCCEDFATVDCTDCDPFQVLVPLSWGSVDCSAGGLLIFTDVTYPGNITVGMEIDFSGWSPSGLNGTGTVTDVSGSPGDWVIEVQPAMDCEGDPETGTALLETTEIPEDCTNEVEIVSIQNEDYFVVIGESVGPMVQLQYAPWVFGNSCDDYTWNDYGSPVSQEEFETVGILFDIPIGLSAVCVRIISFSPVSDCTYENSECVCNVDD